jgi:hypothetical protein
MRRVARAEAVTCITLSWRQPTGEWLVVQAGETDRPRHRVVVSTDTSGTDPDDFQSMVHLLVYADVLDIEGIVSFPFDQGRKEDILSVIDCYEKDCANLRSYSDQYPTPDALRAITMQGVSQRPTRGQVLRPVLVHAPA